MTENNDLTISIVVPVYNEENRIEEGLKKIYEYVSKKSFSYEVLISDDGSTDKTCEIVERYKAGWKQLKLLKNPHRGKAPAVISGIYATSGKYVLMTDIDLSVPIENLDKMMKFIEGVTYKVIIASREGHGAKRINEPLIRHIMGRVFNALVQIVVLPGINDTQCGFKLFEGEAIKKVFTVTKLYSKDDEEIKGAKVSAFDVEILYVARKLGYKIKEVPITWIYGDSSKVHNLKDSYYNAKDVFKIRINSWLGKYKV